MPVREAIHSSEVSTSSSRSAFASTVVGALDPMPTTRLLSMDLPGTGLPAPAPAPSSSAAAAAALMDTDETSTVLRPVLALPLRVRVPALQPVVAGNLGGMVVTKACHGHPMP